MDQEHFIKEKKSIFVNRMETVIDVDFIETAKHFHIQSIYYPILDLLRRLYHIGKPDLILQSMAMGFAVKSTKNLFNKIESITVPDKFITLLTSDLKEKEKNRLLKDCSISSDLLSAIFFKATKLGYKYTYLKHEGAPTQYAKGDLPYLTYIKENGDIEKIGDTNLTEGQLRDLITSSNFLIARIFDNGEHWHCFLQTRKGILGKESGMRGSIPHIHYISDKHGLTKDEFINNYIKKGIYPTIKNHIVITE